MMFNTLTPEQKMQKYQQLNAPSPTENAGVNYIVNPAAAIDNPQTVDYLSVYGKGADNAILNTKKDPQVKSNLEDPTDDPGKNDPYILNHLFGGKKEGTVTPPYKPMDVSSEAKDAFQYYVKQHNLPAHVAAGIVGNLVQESDLRTTAKEKGNTGNGRGIAQWDVRNRWPAFLKWATKAGKDPYARDTQLDYVLVEPGWGDVALSKIMNSKDSDDATMAFGKSFERPNEKYAEWDHRKNVARSLLSGA